jgi:heme/copper-type cytochrome/quinol oxidase subunit 2
MNTPKDGRETKPAGATATRGRPLLLFSLAVAAIGLAPLPIRVAPASVRHVHLQARSYAYSPALVQVNRGDRVTIELESTDVVHGIFIDGYQLEVKAVPGQPARLTFIADRPGTFRLRCSVTCGPLHPFMVGRLRVAPDGTFWRAFAMAILALLAGLYLGARRVARHSDPRPTGAP